MTPIVFLDVDGVLAKLDINYRYTRLNQDCVDALGVLLERTGADIVLSSSWRYSHTPEDFQRLLADYGLTARVIDRTPMPEHELIPGLVAGMTRGAEIGAWLAVSGRGRRFVILDDEEDMGKLAPWLVRTDHRDGLTLAEVEQAIALLNGSDSRVDGVDGAGDCVPATPSVRESSRAT